MSRLLVLRGWLEVFDGVLVFRDQRDDEKNKKSMFSPRRSGPSSTGSNHYTGL